MSEIEKALAVKEKSQAIGEFLEWAQSEGYFLASWQHFGNPEPESYDRLVTSRNTIHQWLAEFFEIDRFTNWGKLVQDTGVKPNIRLEFDPETCKLVKAEMIGNE